MLALLTTILQLLGFACVAVAAFLLSPILGLAVTGALAVLVGYLLERR